MRHFYFNEMAIIWMSNLCILKLSHNILSGYYYLFDKIILKQLTGILILILRIGLIAFEAKMFFYGWTAIYRTQKIVSENWWKDENEPFLTNCSYVNAFQCWLFWFAIIIFWSNLMIDHFNFIKVVLSKYVLKENQSKYTLATIADI